MKAGTIYTAILLISVINTVNSQTFVDNLGIPVDKPCYNQVTEKDFHISSIIYVPTEISFPSPTALPTGIAFYEGDLFVIGYNEYKIFRMSATGTIISEIPIQVQRPYGIYVLPGEIYVLDNSNKKIEVYDFTGQNINTINLDSPELAVYPTGICKIGSEFFYNENKGPQPSSAGDSLMLFNPEANTRTGVPAAGDFASSIGFDGTYLWVNDNPSETTNQIDLSTMEVVQSIKTPGGCYPNGVACDGHGIWLINNASDSIYYIFPPTATSVSGNNLAESELKAWSNEMQITIEYPETWNNSTILLSDMSGRTISSALSNSSGKTVIDRDVMLTDGIYLVVLANPRERTSLKLFLY